MTFHNAETSIASSKPVRLYEFKRGTSRWGYNSSDRDITHNTQVYKTLVGGISDSGIKQTGQATADALKITAPADFPTAQLYRQVAPSSMVEVTIYALHYGIDDYVVVYSGEVRAVQFLLDKCTLTCSALSERMEMTGLRLGWERSCPYALYSTACGVDSGVYRTTATIQSMDGAAVYSGVFESQPDGYYTGGFIEWILPGGDLERRGIQQHSGSKLILLGGTGGLSLGGELRVYPGCRQNVTSCEQFNNIDRYGGIPHLAGESPYGQNIF